MPEQLLEHAETLGELGLDIAPNVLANPLEAPLAAIVSMGYCSASFVSPNGLMVTNHHCVQGALQYHATPEHNYVEDGFLAKTLADEKWNGPSAKLWVTQSITDVTGKILGGLESIDDPKARYDEIEKREKELVAGCETDPTTRCHVASYFRGAEYKLTRTMEIRDVRMVYVPDQGIGVFGGDEDNWMWPRHTGDYSFYRAYVGPDGKTAEFSDRNIPYKPKHFLKIASEPLKGGDLVFVAGYPGRTYRHKTAAEVSDAVVWTYPRRIASNKEIAAIESVTKNDPEAKIKATSMLAGLGNSLKNSEGMLDGLSKGGLADKKSALEAELKKWIAADEERNGEYGGVLEQLDALREETLATRERDSGLGELSRGRLLVEASMIVQMAEERPKPDADRKPSFQERQWQRLEARSTTLNKRYHAKLDATLFGLGIERAMRHEENSEWLTLLFGKTRMDRSEIDATLAKMYAGSRLTNDKVRLKLLKTATLKELAVSKDPFVKMALKLRPLELQIEESDKTMAGKVALLKPKYLAALRAHAAAMDKGPLAPDANSTLRVTFGTVRGYKPNPEADMYEPFTVLNEVVAKHKDAFPFDVPDAQLAAIKEKKFGPAEGPYIAKELGEIPVNFLTDLDTTGGNSGSPTLNRKGEFIGLIFDGNYESMASDYVFMPELTRSIHCDYRYMLWLMDAVDGADRLLEEMGVTPIL
ncbi:MAG: S46 family peptidase [Myxococcales bacterium]|nr:S46 family peptidase [Myxococcales bacterium]